MSERLAPLRRRLENGLTIIAQENPASAAVSVSLSVAAGSCLDPPGQEGLASLMGRGLTRGTRRRDKQAIGAVLDDRGALLSGSAGRHSSGLGARCRGEDLAAILELVADCAGGSTFPDEEVARVRGDRLTSLQEDEDDPATVVGHALREMIYPPQHPYSRRSRGTRESVTGIAASDLRALYADTYHADRALLVIVGGVAANDAVLMAEEYLGGWSGDGTASSYRDALPVIAEAPQLARAVRRVIDLPDKAQVDVAIGHPGIRRIDTRFWAASVLNMVLGRFAMGGRLGRSVREEQGMAYYTYSSLDAGPGPGPFAVRAGVQPQHVEPAIVSILAEIRGIREQPVGDEELDDAKAAMVRSLPLTLESNEGIAGLLTQIETYDLGFDYLEQYRRAIDAVDAAAVLDAARSILHPDAAAVAIAGPYPGAAGVAAVG